MKKAVYILALILAVKKYNNNAHQMIKRKRSEFSANYKTRKIFNINKQH